jgi:nucleoside-diphosphate kinase
MNSGPVVAMVWQGKDVVKTGRSTIPPSLIISLANGFQAMLGATNPLASAPGTIRGDYAIVPLLFPFAFGERC